MSEDEERTASYSDNEDIAEELKQEREEDD